MDNAHVVIRKFERMMGATHDELMEIGRHPQKKILNEKNSKKIGYFKHNSKGQIERFVYTPKYKLIRFINKTHSTIQNYFSKN